MAQAIESAWAALRLSKSEPAIFWQFIEEQRNNLLMEYSLGAWQGVTVYAPVLEMRASVAPKTLGGSSEGQPSQLHQHSSPAMRELGSRYVTTPRGKRVERALSERIH